MDIRRSRQSAEAHGSSVRQETDVIGRVVAARSFDPYGVPLSGDGGEPFGYTGEYRDAASGLVFLRARYLQVAEGRFLTRDTWPGDDEWPITLNAWVYAGADPLRYSDPAGQMVFELNPDDSVFAPRVPGVIPISRRSKSPSSAFAAAERRGLIQYRANQLRAANGLTSLEKSARLAEYGATLYEPHDTDEYVLDMSSAILGWSKRFMMWSGFNTPDKQRDPAWMGYNIFPCFSGWSPKYSDAGVEQKNNQLYHFWYYVAVTYFDGGFLAEVANAVHESYIPSDIWGIQTGDLANDGKGVSQADRDLAVEGMVLGSNLAMNHLLPSRVGEWMRRNLGE